MKTEKQNDNYVYQTFIQIQRKYLLKQSSKITKK